jgi:hypothetical protein
MEGYIEQKKYKNFNKIFYSDAKIATSKFAKIWTLFFCVLGSEVLAPKQAEKF